MACAADGKLVRRKDVMVGDSGAGGAVGVVPAPAAGDAAAGKYLKADGTWAVVSASGDGLGTDGDKGDITVGGTGTTLTIDANAVTNAKLADVATATFKGRTTAGTGDPEDLTVAQATALLNAMVGDSGAGGTKGLAPAPASGDTAAGKFLKADGTWAVPGGGTAASTTEVLTGTDSSKFATPDAIAALWEKGSDIASAATISIGEGGYHHVTGTTDISDIDFGTDKTGRAARLKFANRLQLVNSSTLICPEGRDLLVNDGDVVTVVSEGSDIVRVVGFMPFQPKYFKILAADDAGGQNVNTAQPWFPTNGGVTLPEDQTYFMEGLLWISRAAGIAPHTTSILFGGTATLHSIMYMVQSKASDAATLTAGSAALSAVATAIQVKASSTSATEQILVYVKGTVRINNAGTFIPQFIYSAAPGGDPTIKSGSYFKLTPVGDEAVVDSGTWA